MSTEALGGNQCSLGSVTQSSDTLGDMSTSPQTCQANKNHMLDIESANPWLTLLQFVFFLQFWVVKRFWFVWLFFPLCRKMEKEDGRHLIWDVLILRNKMLSVFGGWRDGSCKAFVDQKKKNEDLSLHFYHPRKKQGVMIQTQESLSAEGQRQADPGVSLTRQSRPGLKKWCGE